MAKDKRDAMVKAIEVISQRMIADLPDHARAMQLQAEVNRLKLRAEALDNVNARRSPLDTPAAHALKVAKLARKFNSETTEMLNRAARIYGDAINEAQARIDAKVNLRPDSFASEIRAAFRSMNSKAQAELIKQLVTENRGPELAAIVRAPSILTGISDQERATYEKMIVDLHAGPEADEIAKMDDVWSAVHAATRAAGTMVAELTDPHILRDIEQQAAAADEASAAFNQSPQ